MKNKRILLNVVITIISLSAFSTRNVFAQLHGVYTIDKALPASATNYQNFTSAIGDLNSGTRTDGGTINGPGLSAAVTFKVTSGEEFHESLLVLTATGTAADTIAFVKNGVGKNPMIKAPFGTGKQVDGNSGGPSDVMFTLKGASYVTINGINIADTGSFNTVAGNTDEYRMETGFVLTNSSATQGCQHDRIENCNITMDSLCGSSGYNYGYEFGIDVFTSVTPSTLSGTNSYNEFDGDTIPNDNYPIFFTGDGSLHDRGNIIGNLKGNYIPKFGMGIAEQWGNGTYGITLNGNEDSVVIANNYIGGNRLYAATAEFGIIIWGNGSGGSNTGCNTLSIHGNTVLNINWANAAFNGAAIGINNTVGGSLNIYNNNMGNVTAYSYGFNGYSYILAVNGDGPSATNIYNNYIHDLVFTGATTCGACNQLAPMAIYSTITTGPVNISRNHFENISINNMANIKGNVYAINNLYGGAITRCDSNRFDNFSSNASVGTNSSVNYYGGNIYVIAGSGPTSYNSDTIDNFSYTGTASAANQTGYPYAFNLNGTYNRCVVHDISCGAGGSGVYGFTGTGTLNNCKIYNISALGSNNAFGATSSSSITLNNDTIYGISSASGFAAGVYTTSSIVNLYGNMIYGFSSNNVSGSAFGAFIGNPSSSNIINNMINGSVASTGTTYNPLCLSAGSNVNVWFNSVNINNGSSSTTNSCFYLSGASSNLDIRNNIFSYAATSGSGQPFYAVTNINPTAFDYNIFYNTASNNMATFNSTTYTNVNVIGGGTFNTNSQVINPNYIDPNNLHITSQCKRGIQISSVTLDIDGQTRNNPPCIGADEIPALGSYSSVDTLVCSLAPITLHASGGTSYQWNTGASTDTIIVTPTDTTYSVIVSGGSCTSTDSITIKVSPLASLSIIPPSASICNGQSVSLKVSTAGGNYTWSPGMGLNTTTGDSVTAAPTSTTTYTLTGKDSVGCDATDTVVITVIPPPNKPTITVSVTGDSLISSANSYNQWFYDGQAITDSTRPILIIKGHTHGWYYVTVTNPANGCSTTSDSTTSINQLSDIGHQISVYPNPFNGFICITINSSLKNINDWYLQLNDELGRTIYTKPSLIYNNVIDLSNLPAGIYFIAISDKNDRTTIPIIKENQ